jgi:hypothetical protein
VPGWSGTGTWGTASGPCEARRCFGPTTPTRAGRLADASVDPTEARDALALETLLRRPEGATCLLNPPEVAPRTPSGSLEARVLLCRRMTLSGPGAKSLI